ncbi:MAG: hypothetical protein ACYCVB_19390, partial [Bacilli bacterium]
MMSVTGFLGSGSFRVLNFDALVVQIDAHTLAEDCVFQVMGIALVKEKQSRRENIHPLIPFHRIANRGKAKKPPNPQIGWCPGCFSNCPTGN